MTGEEGRYDQKNERQGDHSGVNYRDHSRRYAAKKKVIMSIPTNEEIAKASNEYGYDTKSINGHNAGAMWCRSLMKDELEKLERLNLCHAQLWNDAEDDLKMARDALERYRYAAAPKDNEGWNSVSQYSCAAEVLALLDKRAKE